MGSTGVWAGGSRLSAITAWVIGGFFLSFPFVAAVWTIDRGGACWLVVLPVMATAGVIASKLTPPDSTAPRLPGRWTGALVFRSLYPISLVSPFWITDLVDGNIPSSVIPSLVLVSGLALVPLGCIRSAESQRAAQGWAVLWSIISALTLPLFFFGAAFFPQVVSMWLASSQLGPEPKPR